MNLEEDLNTDLSILESHMDGILERVKINSRTFRRFQAFEMRLLNLNSLAEMMRYVLADSKTYFDLDIVNFCLIDEKDEIREYLESDNFFLNNNPELKMLSDAEPLRTVFGYSLEPYLGRYTKDKCGKFFFHCEKKPVSVALVPLNRRGKLMGVLCLGSYSPDRFVEDMATDFVKHMTSVVSVCLENNLNFETLRRTSLIDTLTGVNNRRFLEQRLGEEVDRAQRNSEPLTCMFFDIDFFKAVNDTYGHQAGDQVLLVIATAIKEELRNNDVLARYGGEEFVALLSNISEAKAQDIAERIRKTISNITVEINQQKIQVTISIGLATYVSGAKATFTSQEIAEKLVHCADKALYDAKHAGRDCVVNGGVISNFVAWSDEGNSSKNSATG
jgi:diguanylate cyclase (GGDEF)-like protein